MKVHISAFLRKEISNVGLDPDTISGIKEWELVLSLLDYAFWSSPENSKRSADLSKACAQVEVILDHITKEFLDAYSKKYLNQ